MNEKRLKTKVEDLSRFIDRPLKLDKDMRGYALYIELDNGGVRPLIEGRHTKVEMAVSIETFFNGYTTALDDMKTKKF